MSIDREAEESVTKEWKKPGKTSSRKKKTPEEKKPVEKKPVAASEDPATFDYQAYADTAYNYVNGILQKEGLTGEDYDLFYKHSLPYMERIHEIEFEKAVTTAKPHHYKEHLQKWMKTWTDVIKRHREYKAGLLK